MPKRDNGIEIYAEIKGLSYTPLLCRKLDLLDFGDIGKVLSTKSTSILKIDEKNQVALSRWVSPKRTRSYPYARVYDTLNFVGKRATVIPVIKDEGKDGDRDYLEWDTISLMSLLGIYVILSYYATASRNPNYMDKITNQRFDIDYTRDEIQKLLSYQSDSLHWNLSQADRIYEITQKALDRYENISRALGVEVHSEDSAQKRIDELRKGREKFIELSRGLAQKAQNRESVTIQPKEKLIGVKATITIKNYLGGYYYLTCDEVEIYQNELYLIESKHSKIAKLPSRGDIKDGLVRMMLFANLDNVVIEGREYNPVPVLKLTTDQEFDISSLSRSQKELLDGLIQEAKKNGFKIKINERFLNES